MGIFRKDNISIFTHTAEQCSDWLLTMGFLHAAQLACCWHQPVPTWSNSRKENLL